MVAAMALAGLFAVGQAFAADLILELKAGRDFQGEVRSASYDPRGIAWVATTYQLFRAENGRTRLVDSAGDDRRIALAPGGERYAWLGSRGAHFGQFNVELKALEQPIETLRDLDAKEFPPGFGSLYLGSHGRLLVAIRPLQDLEGLRGEFGYAFFSGDGVKRGAVVRIGLRNAFLDDSGEAVLLLGESEVEAFAINGKDLWHVAERYENGALANGGAVALLNPSGKRAQVHAIHRGVVTRLAVPAPVRSLAITPDGTRAVVASDGGELSLIELDRCRAGNCPVRNLRLPMLGAHRITDMRFINRNTIALGVLLATGLRTAWQYYGGSVVILSTTGAGNVVQRPIDVPLPATGGPKLDVTFGQPEFAAFTPSTALFLKATP